MRRHLTRLAVLLGCLLLLTAAAFADNINTDDDKADKDGSYSFTNETEKYGYRSYLYNDNNDDDNYVGARLYDITIPDEGKLVCEISSSQIKHMAIDIFSQELKEHIVDKSYVIESGETVVMESMALPKGVYTVIFEYDLQPSSIIPYDEDAGKKYFNHYISWKKASYVRASSVSISKTTAELGVSEYMYLNATVGPSDAYYRDVTWSSSNGSVATVDEYGGVRTIAPGKAVIKATTKDGVSASCTVTVTAGGQDTPDTEPDITPDTAPEVQKGTTKTVSAGRVVVTSTSQYTVAFQKARNKKSITVPATVTIGGERYKVTHINANAFTGSNIRTVKIGKNVKVIRKGAFKRSRVTKVILKTKLLKKKTVKGCLNGSKVKTVQLKLGSKSLNKKYKKTYKKIFTKKNTGRKVAVK